MRSLNSTGMALQEVVTAAVVFEKPSMKELGCGLTSANCCNVS